MINVPFPITVLSHSWLFRSSPLPFWLYDLIPPVELEQWAPTFGVWALQRGLWASLWSGKSHSVCFPGLSLPTYSQHLQVTNTWRTSSQQQHLEPVQLRNDVVRTVRCFFSHCVLLRCLQSTVLTAHSLTSCPPHFCPFCTGFLTCWVWGKTKWEDIRKLYPEGRAETESVQKGKKNIHNLRNV